MGRGSPIPPMLRRKIVEQNQKGVSQRRIDKLSLSTVHNIIQRFRESGTISVCKVQGRKTILDARDLRALRRHCITSRNATVMEITTWAQEYFQKTLSVNTIHRAIRRCQLKLYRSKKKPYLNMIQKLRCFLWAKAHLKWTVAKWKTVLWSDESKFVLFGKLGRHVIRTKEDKDNPSCYQRSVQKPASLMVWGCMSEEGSGY
uniref:Transposase Tc1-like domain-containing protein n=1 Tax=Cyprinus carpio carpio TaxID=630221 RepID=A0A9J8AGX4_CYPCA